ncbi:phosphoenolpyruvate-protein phosphotransferase [Spiroplasma mirum ATCC 29335]|uniref:Phosphoenolpyruvate-protein phosphotransferase n=1 Tax=Spiroplasma mirum ATCC 29335 TaxID=838561 RepID=W0GMH5_9MOLU|nr:MULTISPECIES: phosphoenolpyruvate--protein phosphotransferase [Spiroplasma]AHF61460.1 phosphoenolpyruvate-protein phosphotransferase [Spiroplasma mirum ATCC 29335]AHI58600.1 phosphoenolpyruvate-protein phosphotransferase [Spiroplasma mirum ATCC 29335]AKM53504.1 phosphoenolpyruvate-protein phosphotransferase [Spiroplasma atrichopogonis]
MSNKIKGIGSSNGIAIAKVFKLEEPRLNIEKTTIDNVADEIKLLDQAISKAKGDIEKLQKIALEKLGAEKAAIFEAHGQILQDPVMLDEAKGIINNEKLNAAYAIDSVAKKYIEMFSEMDDPYFKERVSDIKDVTNRLVKYILDVPVLDLATINEEVIIVANDLTPSQTAQLNPQYAKGFACDMGGRTSHAAIMGRSLEIPAVLGLKNITTLAHHGDYIIIDGTTGEVILKPEANEIKEWTDKKAAFIKKQQELLTFKDKPTVSKDGFKCFTIEGNIGSPKDVQGVLDNGGEGVGLFRSEFLYMDNDYFPTEDEQFVAYKAALEGMQGRPVIIRTLDIGGDKKLSYFKFPEEMNPFLGYRAIRLCLDREDVFRTQLRALLRASAFGKLGIMFPMIATIDEFKKAKAITLEEKANLLKEGHKVADDIEIGMMMEVPAAAVLADQFAKHADFFSIGTNDLIQYTMAADRMSQFVSYLYQPYNPSILRLLKSIIDGAHKEGKWVGMCGEMAGEPLAIPILMGMKLDYFSMSATSILRARSIISKLDTTEMAKLVETVLNCETSQEVINLVEKATGDVLK